jgi:hypothetical protein
MLRGLISSKSQLISTFLRPVASQKEFLFKQIFLRNKISIAYVTEKSSVKSN